MKIICISGKAQHGKDTTAAFMRNCMERNGKCVLITHYGDLVKYVCEKFFAWDGEKDERGRALLQIVGTDVVRAQSPDYWVNFVASILSFFHDEWDYVLIPDARFPNEIEVLSQFDLDVLHLRVVRAPFESPLTPRQQNHISETALDNYRPDEYIYNFHGLEELKKTAEEAAEKIMNHDEAMSYTAEL